MTTVSRLDGAVGDGTGGGAGSDGSSKNEGLTENAYGGRLGFDVDAQ